jgi:site-specific DNA recombinase
MSHSNANTPHRRYFVYLRKSTSGEERQTRSIPDQLAEIRELVRKEAIEVVDVLAESQSAKVRGRPVFDEMLARIEKGEADGIISWHPDRLARNAHDGGAIIDMLDEGAIQDLRFCTFWFENTAQGKFMLMWAFGQSKYYVDKLSDDIRRGQRRKVAEGVWSWKAPVGYLNDPKTRTIVPDPARAPIVKQMFAMYATGEYPILQISHLMNKAGLRSDRARVLALSSCQHILKNTFYYGVFRLNGEMHIGAHEPLVTKEIYDRCQEVMNRRGKSTVKPRLKSYVYRGLMRCGGCGCMITMETQKGHNYLRCTKRVLRDCPQPYLREEVLTAQIADALTGHSIPDDWADWMVAELETEQARSHGAAAADRHQEQQEIKKIDQKLDRLTAGYLEAGAFTATEFRNRKEELVTAKRVLMEKATARTRTDVLRFEPVIRFIYRSKQAKTVAARLDPAELRAELQQVGSNLTLNNRTLVFDPRGAWKTVVGQGSFAHNKTAAPSGAAVFRGETHHVPLKWS